MENYMQRIAVGFGMALRNEQYYLPADAIRFIKVIGGSEEGRIAASYYMGLRDGKHYKRSKKGKTISSSASPDQQDTCAK